MNSLRIAAITTIATLTCLFASCGKKVGSDLPSTGPAYILSSEGADQDVHDVLLQILRERMKPVRVASKGTGVVSIGKIHAKMRVYQRSYENSDRSEKASVPTEINAKVSIETFEGSSNWDGEHSIGFETDGPHSFSDSAATRRRFANKLLKVAVKQLPGRGVFKHSTLSVASPAK